MGWPWEGTRAVVVSTFPVRSSVWTRTALGKRTAFLGAVLTAGERVCLGENAMACPATVIRLKNDIRELERLCLVLEKFAEQHDLPPKILFDLTLALDELVTNIISYGFPENGEHEIFVQMHLDGDVVHLLLEDDGQPFNPLDMPDPDTNAPLEERRIGGLGILLVKRLMSTVEYEHVGTKNILRITKDCTSGCPCRGEG